MFNIGFAELILVLLIAFLIVGPKDLPRVARFLGRCVKWVRSIIAELKAESGWDDMMRETGDIRKDVDDAIKQMDLSREFREARKDLKRSLEDAKRGTYGEKGGSVPGKQEELKSAESAEKAPETKETEDPQPEEKEKETENVPDRTQEEETEDGQAAEQEDLVTEKEIPSPAPGSWKAYKTENGGGKHT